jgi:hypothetical protein
VVQAALSRRVLHWYYSELLETEAFGGESGAGALSPFELSVNERRRKGGFRFVLAIAVMHTAASNPGVALCGVLAVVCLPLLYIGLGVAHLMNYFLKLMV